MTKYKVLKQLPWHEVGDIFETNNAEWYMPNYIDRAYLKNIIEQMLRKGMIEEVKEPEKPKTVWDLKEGDKYYWLGGNGNIDNDIWKNNWDDQQRRAIGNIFLTYEEAEKEVKKRRAVVDVNRRITELNEGWKPDFSGNSYNYLVQLDSRQKFDVGTFCWGRSAENIDYCKSRYIADQIISEFPKELKIIFDVV